MPELLQVVVFGIIIVIVTRPIIVMLHELGHLLAALGLSRKGINLYLGSIGTTNRLVHFNLGRINVSVDKNPLKWANGLVSLNDHKLTATQYLIIVIAGPLMSIFIAIASYRLLETPDMPLVGFLFFGGLIGGALFDLIISLIPNSQVVKLPNQVDLWNDGYQIKKLIKQQLNNSRNKRKYAKEINLYQRGYFANLIICCDERIANGDQSKYINIMLIDSLLSSRDRTNVKRARKLIDDVVNTHDLNSNEYIYLSGKFMDASELQNTWDLLARCIELYPNIADPYVFRANINLFLRRFDKTINDYNKAISLGQNDAIIISNRGLSKIKTGDLEGGFQDVEAALKDNPNDQVCIRNKGIYFFEINEYDKALPYLNNSLRLNPHCGETIIHLNRMKNKSTEL